MNDHHEDKSKIDPRAERTRMDVGPGYLPPGAFATDPRAKRFMRLADVPVPKETELGNMIQEQLRQQILK